MTSAGLTASSSASSLTVIVVGSSIAPRSRGSIVCTCEFASPGRRGGLRGPRRPRVPLLLLANCSSLSHVHHRRSGLERLAELRRNGCLQRPPEGSALDGEGPAGGVATEICAPAGQPPGFIHCHPAVRRSDDPDEIAFVAGRSAGDAGPGGDTSRRVRAPGYDATSSVAAFLVRVLFSGTAAASAEVAAASAGVAAASAPASAAG